MIEEQKEIAMHYGLEHQLLKLVEELGEAQTEVGRYLQGERADKGRLVEELSDVVNLAQQVFCLLGAEVQAAQVVREKCCRQMRRLHDVDLDQDTLKMLKIFEPVEASRE